MSNRIRDIIITVLITVFFYSSVSMGYELIKKEQEKQANSQLQQMMEAAMQEEKLNSPAPEIIPETPVSEEKADEPQEPVETEPPKPEILPRFKSLYALNSDLAGWLKIEDTDIDYPVMYTPEDQNYYLHLAFDETEAYSGTLFIGVNWDETTNHTIIYGHNMKNGTMFGSLQNYGSEEYAAEHSTINFATLTEEGEYTVFAAFFSKKFNEDRNEEGFRYYYYTDLSDEETFNEYIEQVREESLFETDVEVEFGSKILTLSTCSYHVNDGRFVVVAVEKNS